MNANMKRIGCCAIVVLCGLSSAAVRAQVRPEAEKLFRDGKERMKQGKIAEACAAFEASEKASHSVATVLNLADCREKNQQYASAWALFLQADSETRTDAAKAALNATARRRAAALEPRLSYLTINVPDESRIGGLTVSRDGIEIDHAEWNSAIPLDGGLHEISGKAPGREPWSTKVVLAPERDRQSVEVPKFKELSKPVTLQTAMPAATTPPPAVPRSDAAHSMAARAMGMALTLRIAPGSSGASGDNFDSDLESVGSVGFGLELAYPFNQHVWITAGAGYAPMGTAYELLVGDVDVMLYEKITYLQVPVALRIEAPIQRSGVTLRLFGRAGLSLDLAAERGGTFEMDGSGGSLSDPELAWYDEHSSLNIGALLGAGLEAGLGTMPSIYVGLDITHGRHLLSEWSAEFFDGGANYRYNETRIGLSLRYQWLR